MLEDSTIEALIRRIEQEINVVEGGIEDKFKYLLIGKINGMLEALRIMR